jgi:hypothetical protein
LARLREKRSSPCMSWRQPSNRRARRSRTPGI